MELMKAEDIQLIIDLIQARGEIKSSDIATLLDLTKRRVFDVLPVLEVMGVITRPKRGSVVWVKKDVPIITNSADDTDTLTYNTNRLLIKAVGAITSVKNLGAQEMMIEQTAEGFTIEALIE